MKKLLLIHTGGTFGMTRVDPERTLKPGNLEAAIEEYVPICRKIADIDIIVPFNLDSSDIGPEQWILLSQIIKTKRGNYDAFVIIHGTDTLVYTASALSYLLTEIDCPVILTGSQRPLSEIRSDARSNLISSIEMATLDLPEVTIFFGNQLLRGNRAIKRSIESFTSFESPNYPALAELGLRINIREEYLYRNKTSIKLDAAFNSEIQIIRIAPGIGTDAYAHLLDSRAKGIIIQGFGAGNLPEKNQGWLRFIERAVINDSVVVIGSQSIHGSVDLGLYSSGKAAANVGAIGLNDMTMEAALVKLMLLCGQNADRETIVSMFQQSIAGEMS